MSRPRRLWNRDFLLLWQGQLVSQLGNAIYRIAIGFWILAATGSTVLMGALMAASLVPRVLLSPLCGTWADRGDRKWLLVWSDAVAGGCVVLVGLAALTDVIEVWMVFVAAGVIGAASSLFDPAVTSAVADMVPKRRLGQANASLALLATGAAVVGNALGGFLYQSLGAALLFLVNGLSYLASASSELFIRIPAVRRPAATSAFWQDLRDGLALVWRDPGLRVVYLLTAAINICSTTVFVALLPLFHRAAHLGAGAYGLLMGALSVGAFAGFFGASALAVKPAQRLRSYVVLGLVQAACFGALPWLPALAWMLPIMAVTGLSMSVQDALLTTALQLAVPEHMRGKAFGLRATLMLSLAAVAMVGAGVLAELMAVEMLITAGAVGMAFGTAVLGGSATVQAAFRSNHAAPDA